MSDLEVAEMINISFSSAPFSMIAMPVGKSNLLLNAASFGDGTDSALVVIMISLLIAVVLTALAAGGAQSVMSGETHASRHSRGSYMRAGLARRAMRF